MCTWSPILWTVLYIITCISAQKEEMLYAYDFEEQLDWIVDEGTYNPDKHTYVPIKWVNDDKCPDATDASKCLRAMKDGSISRQISTVGFHSIRLQIDVAAYGVEIATDDWCVIQYRTQLTNWKNVNLLQGQNQELLNKSVFIPDNNTYNNEQSFEVKVAIAANAGGDNCLFDNLKVFGIPYTSYPTSYPTSDPTPNPTYPSFSPTNYPSSSPTQPPTTAPSFTPTVSPTIAPTQPPTLAPSAAPSIAPSRAPSASPTVISPIQSHLELFMYYNMTEELSTIILSIFNEKLSYATKMGMKYGAYNDEYEDYKFLYAVYTCVAFTVSSNNEKSAQWNKDLFDCDELIKDLRKGKQTDKYMPSTKSAQYLAVIKVILTGNDANDSERKANQLTQLFTTKTAQHSANITVRRMQEMVSFTQIVENCMNQKAALEILLDDKETCTGFLGLDLDAFKIISLDATMFVPPVYKKTSLIAKYIVNSLRLLIYVFIACCLITAIAGKMYAKKVKADNIRAFALFFFSLYTWDFYSDIMFCVRLAEYYINEDKHAHIVFWLFLSSALFIFVPWILNMWQLFRAQKLWTTDKTVQEGVRGWFVDWSMILIVTVAVTGSSFAPIELANSNLFGYPLFCMGLASHHLKAFQGKRFFSSVLFENAPQLITQIYFLTLLRELDEATFVALLSSSISVVLSVVDIWSAKHLVSIMKTHLKLGKDIAAIELNVDTKHQSFDEIECNKILFVNKPNALKKAIAETLVVHERNIEIYQLIAGNPGIKVGFTVFCMDHHAEVLIHKLKKEIRKLQLLISIYWIMKTYPKVTDIKKGDNVSTDAQNTLNNNIQSAPTLEPRMVSAETDYLRLPRKDLLSLESIHTAEKILLRDTDPELSNYKIQPESASDESDENDNTEDVDECDTHFDDAYAIKLWLRFMDLKNDEMDNIMHMDEDTNSIYMENIEKLIDCKVVSNDNDINTGSISKWMMTMQNIQILLNMRKNMNLTQNTNINENKDESSENDVSSD